MNERSHAFRRFLESYRAPRSNRLHADDFDLAALAQLAGPERAHAEALLLEHLVAEPADHRVAGALALVGGEAALPALHAALQQASDLGRLRFASALGALDAAFDPVPTWLALLGSDDPTARAGAARALAAAPRSRAQPALLDALGDRELPVRASAFGALLDLHGLTPAQSSPWSRLRAIGTRLLSDLRSVSGPAADELRELVRKLEGARSPASLGLEELPTSEEQAQLERVVASLRDGQRAFDLDVLDRLGRTGRQRLECLLLGELHDADPRVAQALVALGSRAAVAPLREVLSRGDGPARCAPARAAAALALERLTRDGSGRAMLEAAGTEEARQALASLAAL